MRFAPHTALPRVKGVHQPRDSAVFSSKQTATATAGGRRASVEQWAQAVKGVEGGGQSIHICPPLLPACATPLAGDPPRSTTALPPPPKHHAKRLCERRITGQ